VVTSKQPKRTLYRAGECLQPVLGSFTDPNPGAVALYLAICAVVTLVAVFSYGETRRRDLAQDKGIVTRGDARTVETV
jgi:hypothetical protein